VTKMFSQEQVDELIKSRIERATRIIDEGLEQEAAARGINLDDLRTKLKEIEDVDAETDAADVIAQDEKANDLKKQIEVAKDKEQTVTENWRAEHELMLSRNALEDLFESLGGRSASFAFAYAAIQREAEKQRLSFSIDGDQLVIKSTLDGEIIADKNPENLMKDFLRTNDYYIVPSFDKNLLVTNVNDYVKARFDALEYGIKTGKYRDSNDESYKEELQSTIDMMNAHGAEQARQEAEADAAGTKAFEKLSPAEREKALSGGESAVSKADQLLPGESSEAYARRLGFWDGDQNVAKPAGQ